MIAAYRSGPLSVSAFRLLCLGQLTSTVGDYCYAIALPWLVLPHRGSVTALGIVLACYGVPRALLTLAGGWLADRFGPRPVMLASDAGRCALTVLLTVLLAVLAAAGQAPLPVLAPVAAALGACSALFLPASLALMPSLIDNDGLIAANALYTSFVQVGSMLGPMIGGILVTATGPPAAFAVDSASYLVSAASLALIGRAAARRGPPGPATPAPVPSAAVTPAAAPGTWALLRTEPLLRVILVVSVGANVAITGTTEVTLPALTPGRYGAAGFGAALTGMAVMSVIGALGVAWLGERVVRAALIAGAFQVAAVAIAVAPFLGGLPGLVACLGVCGLALGFDNAVWGTMIQRWAPPGQLGRVWGVLMLASVGTFPLSTLLAATLTRDLGPAPVFPIVGGLLAVSYLFGLSQRGFRELGHPRAAEPGSRAGQG
jgi:MFS family permease